MKRFFLCALFLVAFLSGLAALEVIVGSLADDAERSGLSRGRALLLLGLVEAILIVGPAFKPDIIGLLDLVFGSGMLATGCALSLILLTRCLPRSQVIDHLGGEGSLAPQIYWWLRWCLPPVFLSIIAASFLG